jgi:hypothetical protein
VLAWRARLGNGDIERHWDLCSTCSCLRSVSEGTLVAASQVVILRVMSIPTLTSHLVGSPGTQNSSILPVKPIV